MLSDAEPHDPLDPRLSAGGELPDRAWPPQPSVAQDATDQPNLGAATRARPGRESTARTKARAELLRAAIRLRELVAALEDHALGKVEMTASQIRVAEALLRKVLPDLPAKQDQGEASPGFTVEIVEPQA
jgi:hypothetical protein